MSYWVDFALTAILMLVMLGLGMDLRKADLKNLFLDKKSVLVGLFGQMIILPAIAWSLLYFFPNLSISHKMGILILSICPGGIMSNLVSYFLRANLALAISLTILNAFLSLLTIPLLIILFSKMLNMQNQQINLDFWVTLRDIFYITIVPAVTGYFFRIKFAKYAFYIRKYLKWVMPILLLIVFGFKFLASGENGGSGLQNKDILVLAPIVIALNILSMLAGFAIGKIFKLSNRNIITTTIEIGLHNTALALVITGSKLHNTQMQQPALVYAMFSVVITFAVAWILSYFFPYKENELV